MKTNATGVQGTARTWHQTVRVAATANSAASGLLTIDGIALATGDRVLLTAQSSGVDNGIYVADAGIWIRAVDMLVGSTVEPTAHVPVSEGTSNEDSTFQLTTDGSIIVGTTSMTFAKIAGGGGGGGTPGGTEKTIQFNSDPAGTFSGNTNLTYDLAATRLTVNASDMLVSEDGDVVLYADGTLAGTQRVGVGTDAPDTKLHVIDASGGINTKQATFAYDATNIVTIEASSTGQLAIESRDCHQFFRSTDDTCVYHYLQHSTSGTTTASGLTLSLSGADAGIVNQESGSLVLLTKPPGNAKNCDGIRMANSGASRIRLNLIEITTATSTLTSTDVNSFVCIDNSTPHATVTITLPDTDDATQPIKSGCWFEFKDAAGNASTNPITIQVDGGSSDTIDGVASITLSVDYASVKVFVLDTNRYMIA